MFSTNNQDFTPQQFPMSTAEISDFIKDNARLIHAVVRPFRGCAEYEDMYQEASVGMWKGCQSYNPNRGIKLTTYAFECATNEVRMYLRKNAAKSRTGIVLSLETGAFDSDGDDKSMLDSNLEEQDRLRGPVDSPEDTVCRNILAGEAMNIVNTEMTYEQKVVIDGFLQGRPQEQTAQILGSSQSSISKLLKMAICELVVRMKAKGLINEGDTYEG